MKRLERDRRHVESIVDVRKIVSVQQIHHRREVTIYLGKTVDIAAEDAAHLQEALGGHMIRSVIISRRINIRVHVRQCHPRWSAKNLILGTMDKSEIPVWTGVDRLHGLI